MSIDELVYKREQLSLTIKESTAARKDLERQIIAEMEEHMAFELEATHEYHTDTYRLRAKTAMTRTVDPQALAEFQTNHPDVELPIKHTPQVDLPKLQVFAKEHPYLYHELCYAITSKPRAVSLSIKES